MSCPITGEKHCKCIDHKEPIDHIDLKSTLRKLFTDHGVYTAFVLKSIIDDVSPDVFLKRLLVNQKDIGDELKPLIGNTKGNLITKLLTEHIKLAGECIKAAAKHDKQIQKKLNMLFKNSDQVAAALSSINPQKLPYDITQEMFEIHNNFVVDMAMARVAKDYKKEQILYDAYYNELLDMSDHIYLALLDK